jgi:hypothetical protein
MQVIPQEAEYPFAERHGATPYKERPPLLRFCKTKRSGQQGFNSGSNYRSQLFHQLRRH